MLDANFRRMGQSDVHLADMVNKKKKQKTFRKQSSFMQRLERNVQQELKYIQMDTYSLIVQSSASKLYVPKTIVIKDGGIFQIQNIHKRLNVQNIGDKEASVFLKSFQDQKSENPQINFFCLVKIQKGDLNCSHFVLQSYDKALQAFQAAKQIKNKITVFQQFIQTSSETVSLIKAQWNSVDKDIIQLKYSKSFKITQNQDFYNLKKYQQKDFGNKIEFILDRNQNYEKISNIYEIDLMVQQLKQKLSEIHQKNIQALVCQFVLNQNQEALLINIKHYILNNYQEQNCYCTTLPNKKRTASDITTSKEPKLKAPATLQKFQKVQQQKTKRLQKKLSEQTTVSKKFSCATPKKKTSVQFKSPVNINTPNNKKDNRTQRLIFSPISPKIFSQAKSGLVSKENQQINSKSLVWQSKFKRFSFDISEYSKAQDIKEFNQISNISYTVNKNPFEASSSNKQSQFNKKKLFLDLNSAKSIKKQEILDLISISKFEIRSAILREPTDSLIQQLKPKNSHRQNSFQQVESKVFGKYKNSISLSTQDAEFQSIVQKALKVMNTDTKENFFRISLSSQKLDQVDTIPNPEDQEEQQENQNQTAESSDSSTSSDESNNILKEVQSDQSPQLDVSPNEQKIKQIQVASQNEVSSMNNQENHQKSIDWHSLQELKEKALSVFKKKRKVKVEPIKNIEIAVKIRNVENLAKELL